MIFSLASKYISVVVLISSFLSFVLFTSTLVSTNWLEGKQVINQSISTNGTSNAFIIVYQDLEYGLHKLCEKSRIQAETSTTNVTELKFKEACTSYKNVKNEIEKMRLSRFFKDQIYDEIQPFEVIFIFITITVVMIGITLPAAVLRTPCVKFYEEHLGIIVTGILLFLSSVVGLGTLVFANHKFNNHNSIQQILLKVSYESSRGKSYNIAWLAEGFCLIAFVSLLIEAYISNKEELKIPAKKFENEMVSENHQDNRV